MLAKIDKLGRVVIPVEYRKRLGISLGDEVDIKISDGGVVIAPIAQSCCVCGKRLDKSGGVPLCDRCVDFVITCRGKGG